MCRTVEVANQIEPEEWVESMGEGGGCNEDVSDVCELGEATASSGCRAERKPWLSAGDVA